VYLGDLATLSDAEAIAVALGGGVSLAFLASTLRSFSRRTFDVSALRLPAGRGAALEYLPFLVLPALSTWAAGFLFTCACLFVPVALLAREGDSSAKCTLLCAGVALVCAPLGLALSLAFDGVPTVPSLVALLAVAGLGVGFIRRLRTAHKARFRARAT
jgi:ABC-type Mn2+/Zn2+ transport system permease subunit